MARNTGYLTSKHTPESDNVYTPNFVVHAIAKYIPREQYFSGGGVKTTKILCPFDKNEHAFPTVFRELGYDVINTHFDPETAVGTNFFSYSKEDMRNMGIDCIVSNPPFSVKDCVLEHCEELDAPYALLLPLPTLQSNRRFKNVFSKGKTEVLIFDKRIPYSTKDKDWTEMSGNHFASIFICKNILPKQLIFDAL